MLYRASLAYLCIEQHLLPRSSESGVTLSTGEKWFYDLNTIKTV